MISNKSVFLVIFISVQKSFSLIELPRVEENDILKTEGVIRTTINGIFSLLGEKETYTTPRIKHYGYVHNYFVSLTIQDYNCLKEIAKLTRVNKSNIDNGATDFIDTLTKIIEENKIIQQQDLISGDDVKPHNNVIEYELQKINYLKINLEDEANKNLDINKEVLKILEDKTSMPDNVKEKNQTKHEGSVLDDLDFWKEEEELGSGRRLYNAKPTRVRNFAFMASILAFSKFQCAGSIIQADLVVTAASCLQLAWNNRFYRENPTFISVRVGSDYYEVGGDVIGVLEIFFYPSYNPKTINHNIALMRLQRKIKFKKRKKYHVKKISLDKEESGLPINPGKITVVGWGARTWKNKVYSPNLDRMRYDLLDIYPLQDCQDIYSKEFVTEKNFCAGFVTVGSGACNKDLGGPGIVSGVLTGIISFGAPVCGTADAPTVFTKVGFYYDWIETIMEQPAIESHLRTTTIDPYKNYLYPKEFRITTTHHFVEPEQLDLIQRMPNNYNTSTNKPKSKRIPVSTIYSSSATKPNIHHIDKKIYKDFLKTIFESQDIDDYMDTIKKSPDQELPTEHYKNTFLNKSPQPKRIHEAGLSIASTTISNVDIIATESSNENAWWSTDSVVAGVRSTKMYNSEELTLPQHPQEKGPASDESCQLQILKMQEFPVFSKETSDITSSKIHSLKKPITNPLSWHPEEKDPDLDDSIQRQIPKLQGLPVSSKGTSFITYKHVEPLPYSLQPVRGKQMRITTSKIVTGVPMPLPSSDFLKSSKKKQHTHSTIDSSLLAKKIDHKHIRTIHKKKDPVLFPMQIDPKDIKSIDQKIEEVVLTLLYMSDNEDDKLDLEKVNKKDTIILEDDSKVLTNDRKEYSSNTVIPKHTSVTHTEKTHIHGYHTTGIPTRYIGATQLPKLNGGHNKNHNGKPGYFDNKSRPLFHATNTSTNLEEPNVDQNILLVDLIELIGDQNDKLTKLGPGKNIDDTDIQVSNLVGLNSDQNRNQSNRVINIMDEFLSDDPNIYLINVTEPNDHQINPLNNRTGVNDFQNSKPIFKTHNNHHKSDLSNLTRNTDNQNGSNLTIDLIYEMLKAEIEKELIALDNATQSVSDADGNLDGAKANPVKNLQARTLTLQELRVTLPSKMVVEPLASSLQPPINQKIVSKRKHSKTKRLIKQTQQLNKHPGRIENIKKI